MMMAKIERRKLKGQNGSRYEAASSVRLTPVDSVVSFSLHAVAMQCLLFILFLLLFVPNISSAGLPTAKILPPIVDHLTLPSGVAVGADETIYVAESTESTNRVQLYSNSGQHQGAIAFGIDEPTAVAVDMTGRIYVGNAGSGNVMVYDTDLLPIGKLGLGNGEFRKPTGIAVGSTGLIYVVDGREHKVKIYNANRSFKSSFGSKGLADGQFHTPTSIVINESTGEILIPDWASGSHSGTARVQMFDLNGVFLRSFVTMGINNEGKKVPFKQLSGIAVDTLDRIYVTDSKENVVSVYDPQGTLIGRLYDDNLSLLTPQGIAFAPGTSRLFIASQNTGRVETLGIDNHYSSIAVSPQSYNFGNITAGAASATQSFDVSNNGNGKLLIEGDGGITLAGANASEFSIVSDDCAGTTVSPAAVCTINVRFEPVSAGSKNASLAIASDDLYMPTLNVALSGNAELQQHKLTVVKSGDGSGAVLAGGGINCGTTCSADYAVGTKVTLSAAKSKDGDSVFAGWFGGGCTGVGECKVTMNQSVTVTAVFNNNPVPVATTYSITASAGANGSISPAGAVSVNEGSTKTFVITAESKYRVSDVLVDGDSVGAVGSYSFKDVDTDGHTISAEFTAVSTLLLSSIEMGEVSVGDVWEQVTLSNTFTDPIVVVKPASSNDTSPAVVQVRGVSAQDFEIRIREWDYVANMDGGQHKEEQVSYVVMERGSYILDDGTRVEAGRFDTDVVPSVRFTQSFTSAPVVTASIVTNEDAEDTPAIVQVSNIGVAGFDYTLREEALNDQIHAVETVSFIAWEASEGMQNGIKFEVGTANALPEQTTVVEFNGSYASSPRLIADLQTANGGVVANLRWKNKSATGIDLLIDQEESLNPISTLQEDIGYLLLSTFDGDCDGLSDEDEVDTYGTDPQLADTDGDGILDGNEVLFWLIGSGWDGDDDDDGVINLLDIDSAGIGLRDDSTVPVGDGTPTVVEVSCADIVVVDGQDTSGGATASSDQESESDSGSPSPGKGFSGEAVTFERSSVGFKSEGVKFESQGAAFKPNAVGFEGESVKFDRN